MKCEFCGGNLDLEAPFCPHCGAVNKHAQRHIEDMNRYQGQFESTKKDVYKTAQKYSDVMVRTIIVAALVIVLVVLLIIRVNAYSINRNIRDMKIRAQKSTHTAIMDDYLENEDFIQYVSYCDECGITWWNEAFPQYYYVGKLAEGYKYFCAELMSMVFPAEYDTEPERRIEWVCSYLNSFYSELDEIEKGEYYQYLGLTEEDVARSVEYGEEMRDHINALLITYFHLTQEEIEGLPEMTNAQRVVLLEEKFSHAE